MKLTGFFLIVFMSLIMDAFCADEPKPVVKPTENLTETPKVKPTKITDPKCELKSFKKDGYCWGYCNSDGL